jgi:hypothetical protein
MAQNSSPIPQKPLLRYNISMGEAIKEPTVRTGPERTLGTFKLLSLDEPISSVVENLPPISILRKMKKPMTIVINGEGWKLNVAGTENASSPKRKDNNKEIIFTRVAAEKDGSHMQRGIVTDDKLKLILGAIIEDVSIGLNQPASLTDLMRELKTELSAK